jgi:hypothetical protein
MQPAKKQKTSADGDKMEDGPAPPPFSLENTAALLAGQVMSGQRPVEQAKLNPETSLVSYHEREMTMMEFLIERRKQASSDVDAMFGYDGKIPVYMCMCGEKNVLRNVSTEERKREGNPLLQCAYCMDVHEKGESRVSNMFVCTACNRIACSRHIYVVNVDQLRKDTNFAIGVGLDRLHCGVQEFIKHILRSTEADMTLFRAKRGEIQKFLEGYGVYGDLSTCTGGRLVELVTLSDRFTHMAHETKMREMEVIKNLVDGQSTFRSDNRECLLTLKVYRNALDHMNADASEVIKNTVKDLRPTTETALRSLVNPNNKLFYARCFQKVSAYPAFPTYTFA